MASIGVSEMERTPAQVDVQQCATLVVILTGRVIVNGTPSTAEERLGGDIGGDGRVVVIIPHDRDRSHAQGHHALAPRDETMVALTDDCILGSHDDSSPGVLHKRDTEERRYHPDARDPGIVTRAE